MFPSPNRNKKKNRRNNRNKKIVIAIAVAVVILVAGYFVFFSGGVPKLSGKLLKVNTEAQANPVVEAMYYLHEQKLGSLDYANNEKWVNDIGEGNMRLHASETMIAVYDTSTLWVYSFDGTELIREKKFHGTIMEVRCGEQLINVLNQDTTGTMHIITLDKAGNEKGSMKYPERFVLDFGFTQGDSSYSYTVDSGSLTPVSRITTQNEQLATIGNVTIEGQVLQHIVFQMDGIYAIGTNHIIKVDYIGAVQSRHMIYGWKYCDQATTNQDEQAILMAPGGENAAGGFLPTARLYIPDKPDVYIQLGAGTMHLALGVDKIYAFSAKQLSVYNFSGEKIADYPLEQNVTAVKNIPGDKKTAKVLLYTQQGVYALALP